MSAARAKGTAAETAVVDYLRAHGWPHCERRALHGNRDRGDIAGIVGVVVEVKAARRVELGVWLDQLDVEVDHDQAAHGVLVVRRRGVSDPGRWYAVTPLADWTRLAREAGW